MIDYKCRPRLALAKQRRVHLLCKPRQPKTSRALNGGSRLISVSHTLPSAHLIIDGSKRGSNNYLLL